MSMKISPKAPRLLEQKHPFRQWKTWEIPGTPWTISGYSRSNDKTFFYIPQLKCCLDAGLCEGRQGDTVFLTHTHNDHSADIEFLASKDSGVTMYLPSAAKDYVEAYLRAKRELNHLAAFDPRFLGSLALCGVEGGQTFGFGKKREFEVRVVECVHKIPCVGYCFSARKSRLKPEFEERKQVLLAENKQKEFGQWMAQLRREGVQMEESVVEPLFAFLGDTHVRVFEQNPWLMEYPVIMTECTFLDDKERERADVKGHTLWSALRPIVESNRQNLFVLTHFSLRHSDSEVVEFFETQKAKYGLENLLVWAHDESLLPEQHQRSA